eukprot:TRINITY_DN11927_c0_g1_i1.p1 TRINITY_DN11927_c0_g1~~TRINITY_DN11927_c0_g1_i1.p1  ORF type:complete len:130 (+),score=24.81 TRINITY_DN11927_c0_g1_i1:55-444(+)
MEKKKVGTNLKSFLTDVIQRIPGARGILVSDKDGVTLVEVSSEDKIDGSLSAIFSAAVDQANKCGFGTTKTITTFYNNKILVQINYNPLVITIVGDENANCGLMMGVAEQLKKAVEPLKNIVNIDETDN